MMNAEFFDIFGFIGFLYIIIFSIYSLKTNKKPKKWLTIALLIIGILGMVIDGLIVYTNTEIS